MISYFQARRMSEAVFKKYRLSKCISRQLPKNKDAKILDIGCGLGQNIKAIKELSYNNVFGVDIDVKTVEFCKQQNLAVLLIDDLLTFLKNNKTKYDLIIMTHLIEHLNKDEVIPILSEIYENTLNSGGVVLIATPNAQSLIGSYWAYEDFTHRTIFTSGSLYYVLFMAGFTDIRFIDIYGTANIGLLSRFIRASLLKIYSVYVKIRNKLMFNGYYALTEQIYTWEIKAAAKKQ
jgi:SAM-dependent methyltransferase